MFRTWLHQLQGDGFMGKYFIKNETPSWPRSVVCAVFEVRIGPMCYLAPGDYLGKPSALILKPRYPPPWCYRNLFLYVVENSYAAAK